MGIKIITKLGVHQIESEGATLKDAIANLGCLTELPDKDPDGNPVKLFLRQVKGYDFYELRGGENWVFPLSVRKETHALYPKGPWERSEYLNRERDDHDDGPPAAGVTSRPYRAPAPVDHKDEDDDLPF